jgi:hypothetical protein
LSLEERPFIHSQEDSPTTHNASSNARFISCPPWS